MSDRRSTGVVPYTFSIVGVQKAGTSTLMAMIHRHQQVARSPRKELHYFDNESRDWSDPDTSDYVCPRTRKRQRIAGDSTPLYIFWPQALQRMYDHRPEMRLIAIFRDPIERVFSQWSMNRGRRPQLTPDWPTYIQTQRHATLPDSLPSDIHVSRYPALSGVVRGFYGQQLERGLSIFPREQWLLLSFREMLADHESTLGRVTEHLGLRDYAKPPELLHRMGVWQGVQGTPVTGEDLEGLAELYAEDLQLFERLSGIDVSTWPTRRILTGEQDPAELAERLSKKVGLLP
jgi:hypothetical protein